MVLYLLAICQLDVEILDFELLVYHTFKVILFQARFNVPLLNNFLQTMMTQAHDSREIELIVDCTNYTTASEIPMQWFKYFIELAPSDLRSRCGTVHILNCNLPMQRFLRKLYNICSGSFNYTACNLLSPSNNTFLGIFNVDISSKLSVADLCDTLQCNVSGALTTACKVSGHTRDNDSFLPPV